MEDLLQRLRQDIHQPEAHHLSCLRNPPGPKSFERPSPRPLGRRSRSVDRLQAPAEHHFAAVLSLRTDSSYGALTSNSPSFDRVADIYDATRSLPSDVMSAVVKGLAEALNGCSTILDVGVGTGRFAKPMQEFGFEVMGIDLAPKMLSKAMAKGIRNLGIADAHAIPLRDRSVDATTIVHVIHLMKDWRVAAREIGRVSRRMVLSVIARSVSGGAPLTGEYSRVRARLGFPLNRLEGAEGALLQNLRPRETIRVIEYSEKVYLDEEIEYLENHGSSRTWGLPEPIHRKIMAELKPRFAGKSEQRTQSVTLAIWSPDQFRDSAVPDGS